MNHTPGPWCLDIDKSQGNWNYNIRTVKPHNPAGGIGKHIATVNPYMTELQGNSAWPCAEQNGHILAAAPELLTTLQALTDWCCSNTSPRDPNSPHELLVAAVAAVAKAKGG